MKTTLTLVLMGMLATFAKAQTPACCAKPPVGSGLLALAKTEAFAKAHEAPEPFQYKEKRGSDITFQTLDGNPRRLNTLAPATCTPTFTGPNADSCRVNRTAAVVRLRANAASSIYHSLQSSVEKRLSNGFSAGVHYTWSSFIDSASEVFNPSSGEVAVSHDSFNRAADRGRSTYDRPHRLTGNFV